MADLRVVLADDHAVVREGLKALINAQSGMAVVGEASDGTTGTSGFDRVRLHGGFAIALEGQSKQGGTSQARETPRCQLSFFAWRPRP